MTMALYEHLLIARQDISAQQVDALATHLKTILEGEDGKVEKQEYWGLRGLAYRIKKNRKGHYVLLNINAPAKAVQELERQFLGLTRQEDIPGWEIPSVYFRYVRTRRFRALLPMPVGSSLCVSGTTSTCTKVPSLPTMSTPFSPSVVTRIWI